MLQKNGNRSLWNKQTKRCNSGHPFDENNYKVITDEYLGTAFLNEKIKKN